MWLAVAPEALLEAALPGSALSVPVGSGQPGAAAARPQAAPLATAGGPVGQVEPSEVPAQAAQPAAVQVPAQPPLAATVALEATAQAPLASPGAMQAAAQTPPTPGLEATAHAPPATPAPVEALVAPAVARTGTDARAPRPPATAPPSEESGDEGAAAQATGKGRDARVTAMAQLQRQRPWSALATLAPFLEAHPDDVDALFIKGLCFFELKKDRAARALVGRVLAAKPNHAMANLLLGFMDQQSNRKARALAHYRRYLGKAPNGRYADEVVSITNQLTPSEPKRSAPPVKSPSALASLEAPPAGAAAAGAR